MAITIGTKSSAVATSIATVTTLQTTTKFIAILGNHQGTVTGCTLNGVNMTKVVGAATAFNETAEIWYLDNPGALTNVTLAATFSGGSGRIVGYVNLEGTLLGTAEITTTATGSASPATLSITPVSDNAIIIGACYSEAALTQGSGENTIFISQGQSFENCGASYVVQTTKAAQTIDFTLSSGQRWALCAAAFQVLPPFPNNYQNVRVGDGMTTGDKVR